MLGQCIALVAAILPAVAPAAERPGEVVAAGALPFSFEEVGFTADCAPNEALVRLLAILAPRVSADVGYEGWVVDEPLYNAVSGDISHILRLDRAAAWHGLRFVEVRLFQGIERGPVNYTLGYADTPEQVRAVWNARGWRLPPAGETRDVAGLEGYAVVGVEADGPLATVTCYRD